MLFVAILPIFYVIFHMRPSNCGPFVGQTNFYSVISDFYYNDIPGELFHGFNNLVSVFSDKIRKLLDHIITPSFMVPAVCVMVLVIYYLQSVSRGVKEQNARLKLQLHYERNEGKRAIQTKMKTEQSRL